MSTCLAVVASLLLAAAGPQRASTLPDLTQATDAELHRHVGERVSMHGRFSLRGKTGPFILVGGRPVYLVAGDASLPGKRYDGLEGKDARDRYAALCPYPEAGDEKLPAAHASDHFYFEAESAAVQAMRDGAPRK